MIEHHQDALPQLLKIYILSLLASRPLTPTTVVKAAKKFQILDTLKHNQRMRPEECSIHATRKFPLKTLQGNKAAHRHAGRFTQIADVFAKRSKRLFIRLLDSIKTLSKRPKSGMAQKQL